MVHPVIRWRSQPYNPAEHCGDGVRQIKKNYLTQSVGANVRFISAHVKYVVANGHEECVIQKVFDKSFFKKFEILLNVKCFTGCSVISSDIAGVLIE